MTTAAMDPLRYYVFLFLDVVRYSTLGDDEQLEIATILTRVVERHHPGSALKNRDNGVFLATGDGFVLAFESALLQQNPHDLITFIGEIKRELGKRGWEARAGLHVWNAQPYKDFNAQFYADSTIPNNLAGAGINIAQRVMSLGDAGDVLASHEFFELYSGRRSPKEAAEAFHLLGRVRVKHGKELDIYRHGSKQQPSRIQLYMQAETLVMSLLRHMYDRVKACAHDDVRPYLKPRVSVLPYDKGTGDLCVSAFRVGDDLSEQAERSHVHFGLDEGPGRAFKEARDGRARVTRVDLPDPETTPRDDYVREFSQKTGIPEEKIRDFSRKNGRCYLYYPLLHGTTRTNVLGILSIDTLSPLYPIDALRAKLERDKHWAKKRARISKRIEGVLTEHVDKLSLEIRDLLRQLSEAYALLSQY